MIKYISTHNITLNIMNRKRTFSIDEEVHENAFTKNYPQYFKKIGTTVGYNVYLSTPTYIPDPIQEFVRKEEIRKNHIVYNPIQVHKESEESLEDILGKHIKESDVIFETEEDDED